MAAVTTLNVGPLDVLLRRRLPRIRSENPNFERHGNPLWTCAGAMQGPGAQPRGGRTDRLPRTIWGAGHTGSPDHSGRFSWLLTPSCLNFCGSRTRSQRVARSQMGGLCRVAATRGLSSLRRGGLWPRRHLAGVLVVSTQLWAHGTWARPLWPRASSAVVLRCGSSSSGAPEHRACGVFLDQGLNPCPWHWQVGSDPWHHQGTP